MVDLTERRRVLNDNKAFPRLQYCPCITKKDICEHYGDIGSNGCIRNGGVCDEYVKWVEKSVNF